MSGGRLERGFSMIELLVAVAVAALLMGLLLPALSAAREGARRAVCMSNLRQMSVRIANYADDFDQQAPLGYSLGEAPGWKQYNYLAQTNRSSGVRDLRWMGLFQEHRPFDPPQSVYCPSERGDFFSFNTDVNPWPPDETAPEGRSTRVGYGSRPVIGWPLPSGVDVVEMPGPLPRVTALDRTVSNPAVMADLLHKPDRVWERHADGINVLYLGGSATWLEVGDLETVEVGGTRWLDTLDEDFDTGFNDVFFREVVDDADDERSLWRILDAR